MDSPQFDVIDPIYYVAQGNFVAAKALAERNGFSVGNSPIDAYNALKQIAQKPGGEALVYSLHPDRDKIVSSGGTASNFSDQELADMKTSACKLTIDELKAQREFLQNTMAYARYDSIGKQTLQAQISMIDECLKIKQESASQPAAVATDSKPSSKLENGLKLVMVGIIAVLVIKGLVS